MRKLQTKDIFSFGRCVKVIGAGDEIKALCERADTLTDAFAAGYGLLYGIFEKAVEQEAEAHVYEFLAGPLEISADEIAEMELSDFFTAVKQIAEENDLVRFFKSAAASTT